MNIKGEHRPLSTYIAGNPGYGKSSLIQKMALWDIKKGRGVCVIDPAADLVNRLIHWIPKSRLEDTIYFDTDDPIPIDFFSYRKDRPAERRVLTDQLLNIFQLDNAPVSKPRLMKILGCLFDANERGANTTFLHILDFIEHKSFRDKILAIAGREWPDFPATKDTAPIVERMTPFFENAALKTMFQSKPKISIAEIMETKKVLLVNLHDTPSDNFIGSLISAKFQQATFARKYIPPANRTPYYLYIDECDTILNYAAKEFQSILVRARKYKLCLILANPLPEDLPPEIQRKLRMMGTLILFNLDPDNAKIFKNLLNLDDPSVLSSLPKFKALCRTDNKLSSIHTPKFLGFSPASYAHIIKKRTYDPDSCNSAQVRHSEGNATQDDTITGEAEEPILPPHHSQKKNPRPTL